MDREDLIKQLAGEYGLEGRAAPLESRYDPTTGTLYVGSRVYRQGDLERAKRFFEKSAKKSRSLNDASSDLYEIGMQAVSMLQQMCADAGGRLIIKNS